MESGVENRQKAVESGPMREPEQGAKTGSPENRQKATGWRNGGPNPSAVHTR